MIVCPSCQHENLDGTVFCSDCGMQFSGDDTMVTQTIQMSDKLNSDVDIKRTAYIATNINTWASYIS